MGVPVHEFNPVRGNDKIARATAVADMFSSGVIWAPEKRWADEVITEVNDFPAGAHDDYCDTLSQALLRIRQGGLISIASDDWGDSTKKRRVISYY